MVSGIPLVLVLEPGCRILMSRWSLGPLLNQHSFHKARESKYPKEYLAQTRMTIHYTEIKSTHSWHLDPHGKHVRAPHQQACAFSVGIPLEGVVIMAKTVAKNRYPFIISCLGRVAPYEPESKLVLYHLYNLMTFSCGQTGDVHMSYLIITRIY